MESSLDLRQVEVEAPLVGHADIDPYARPGRLQEVPARRGSTEGIAAAERKNRGRGGGCAHVSPQPQLLLHDRGVADVQDHVVVVYIIADDAVRRLDRIGAGFAHVMVALEDVVLEVAVARDLEPELVGDHPVGPEVLVGRRDVPVQVEERIPDLANRTTTNKEQESKLSLVRTSIKEERSTNG